MTVKVKCADWNRKRGKPCTHQPVCLFFLLEGVLTCEAGLSNFELTCLGKHRAALDPECFPLVPMCCICTERRKRKQLGQTGLSEKVDTNWDWLSLIQHIIYEPSHPSYSSSVNELTR